MTDRDAWRPGNDGTGKRTWFVLREDESEHLWSAELRLVSFGSYQAAKKAVDRLNGAS